MPNITLSVDEDIIKKVRKIAIDKNTTLTAMVREYLNAVAESENYSKARKIQEMKSLFKALSKDMGKRKWTRDDLYER
ncbi:hypothetical protein Dvar_23410 [Desulfosarcina variabilis str. Montpellier]|jgi:hypothetical protein|uniref:DUF6364 family protein n=1 Tax=Desulfosarcina variabilis TaxID=2300 RepID=UPI003AFAB879